MLHYFRHNRHRAFVKGLILLMITAWLPSAALGCAMAEPGDGGNGVMSHCGFCPPQSETRHHDGQGPHGSGCDFEPCPAMQAADNSQLLDEGVGFQPLFATVPVLISVADVMATGALPAASLEARGLGYQTHLFYAYCSLLI